MAKNVTFRRRYVFEFKGKTTNNFMPGFLDRVFRGIVNGINKEYKQVEIVTSRVEETTLDGKGIISTSNLLYERQDDEC